MSPLRLLDPDVRLFAGKISTREAFEWDLPRMLEFLGAAARDPGHFGVHSQHHSVLKDAVRILEGIRGEKLEEGTNLQNAGVGEKGGSGKKRHHIFTGEKGVIDVIPFKWEGIELPCYSRYDSLVLVLSILGRAPRGATRRNHHLALLVLCAKFLILVAGDGPKGDAPHMVSITFVDEDAGDLRTESAEDQEDSHQLNVLLGATIPVRDPSLKDEIRRLRYDFWEEQGKFCLPGQDGRWRFDGKYAKWHCGSCAETYALVLLKRDTTLSRNMVGGMAITINSVLAMKNIDDVTLENLEDPCEACREGLRQCEIDWEGRFRKSAV